MAGYSGTPLIKKLGIKEGFVVKLFQSPDSYLDLLGALPEGVVISKATRNLDFIHAFVRTAKELERGLPTWKKQIKPNGMIWVSWYKKQSGIATDVTEDVIRNLALDIGLVDVKVCAVDEQWSGLKLVIPVKNRPL